MFTVKIERKVQKFLNSLREKDRKEIIKKIQILSENPFSKELDIKKMKGEEDIFRLRSGQLRLLYKIYKESYLIIVFKGAYRKDIYK